MLRVIRGEAARGVAIGERESILLDLLRCVLLLQVVLGHLGSLVLQPGEEMIGNLGTYWYGLAFKATTRFGRESAFLFVYMSGYFVGGPLANGAACGQGASWRTVVLRRVLRIWPILGLALIVTAAVDTVGITILGLKKAYAAYQPYNILGYRTPLNFIGNLLCLQPTFSPVYGSNGPLWTLGYIVQFSFLGVLVFSGNASVRWVRVSAVGLAMLLIARIDPLWPILLGVWFVGSAARIVDMPRLPPSVYLVLLGVLVILGNHLPSEASAVVSAAAGLASTGWARACQVRLPHWLERSVRAGANLSYSVYAAHFPLAYLTAAALFSLRTEGVVAFGEYLLTSLVLVLIVSLGIQRLGSYRPRSARRDLAEASRA